MIQLALEDTECQFWEGASLFSADDRRLAVLRAIVEQYVDTQEPVGSKNLVARHNFAVSPATIRNDMAALEEAGLISQPHTSAGRIPTDLGYRVFVDALQNFSPLSAPQRKAIAQLLDPAVDFDETMERTVRLLAQFTNSVAVAQYPSLRNAILRHVELVSVSDTQLIMVIITASGRVEQCFMGIPAEVDLRILTDLRQRLNTIAVGKRFADVRIQVEEIAQYFSPREAPFVQAVIKQLIETMQNESEDRIVTAGTANLGRTPELLRTIVPLLDALEEQVTLIRLFANMHDDLAVSIGRENGTAALADVSVITAAYTPEEQSGSTGQNPARLGVVGPTRMNYASTIAVVRAVANYVNRHLQQEI